MTVENYQLKWDSHLTHLNSSVATLYRNDKFADVMLYSSSPESGFPRVGISAHKFILSSSSQFFASIFDSTLPVTVSSGVFHIVLPPDLTQRTIQTLVQYMYCGEATVSNDILSEILKGGELLKIVGLCRVSSNNSEVNNERQKSLTKTVTGENINCTRVANEVRGIGATVVPEESPVILKAPKPPQLGLIRIVNCHTLSGGITVNKEVAIDPDPDEANYCYTENKSHSVGKNVSASCRENGCVEYPDPTELNCSTQSVQTAKITMRSDLHHRKQSVEETLSVAQNRTRQINLNFDSLKQPSQDDQVTRLEVKEEPSDCWHVDQPSGSDAPKTIGVPKIVLKLKVPRESVPAPIKLEDSTSDDYESNDSQSDSTDLLPYTRLICDTCNKSFDEPRDWVRHTERHNEKDKTSENSHTSCNQPSSKTTYVPTKRRRTTPPESPDHVALMCDLCTKSFSTPAEWVRHIKTQHTEAELAEFNNKRIESQHKPETVRYTRRQHTGGF